MKRKRILPIVVLILTVLLAHSPSAISAIIVYADLNQGPYVDEILYRVIPDQDQRILALQTSEIEMDTSFLDMTQYYYVLDTDLAIDFFSAFRNGYDSITINCQYYPLNISGLRRAFAFAFDKTRATAEIMNGLSLEHDSLVPYSNGWCIEDQLLPHYYTAQVATGNALLDDLGFAIDPVTGFRNAPNGQPFNIDIWYDNTSPEHAGGIAQIGVDALQELHISSYSDGIDMGLIIRGVFQMVVSSCDFYDNDVDWLAYEYWSEYEDVQNQFAPHFVNETYDSWRNQLLYSTTYEEVFEAAAEMQKILHYNVPRLVICEDIYLQGYRNDRFTGYVPDLGQYITGPWTMRKIHKIDGTWGGTVPIAISEDPTSFNFFLNESNSADFIMPQLWSSLYSLSPDLNPYPDLAESMIIETHEDTPSIPEGHMRFIINIIQNATWSDGIPLTADDVAFSINYNYYVIENGTVVPPCQLATSYSPNPSMVVVEYYTESFWHFSDFAYIRIIPEHIFAPASGIGVEDWTTWNPVFDSNVPYVTCGPFLLSSYERNNSYSILKNSLFHYRISDYPPPDHIAVTSGTTTSTIDNSLWLGNMSPLSLTISAGSLAVIVLCLFGIYKEKRLGTTASYT